MIRILESVLLAVLTVAGAEAIDGFGPSRPYRPDYLSASKKSEAAEEREAPAVSGPGYIGWAAPVVKDAEPEPPKPGEPAPAADRVAEMKSSGGSEGEAAAQYAPGGKSGPTVHGEMGVTGGAAGSSSYGTVVVEGNKAAITVSGERYRGWWP